MEDSDEKILEKNSSSSLTVRSSTASFVRTVATGPTKIYLEKFFEPDISRELYLRSYTLIIKSLDNRRASFHTGQGLLELKQRKAKIRPGKLRR